MKAILEKCGQTKSQFQPSVKKAPKWSLQQIMVFFNTKATNAPHNLFSWPAFQPSSIWQISFFGFSTKCFMFWGNEKFFSFFTSLLLFYFRQGKCFDERGVISRFGKDNSRQRSKWSRLGFEMVFACIVLFKGVFWSSPELCVLKDFVQSVCRWNRQKTTKKYS